MQDRCGCFVMRGWGSSARRRSRPKRAPNAGSSQAPSVIEFISEDILHNHNAGVNAITFADGLH
jgi:hypothetical protein